MSEVVDVESLRIHLRGALSRETKDGMIEVPAFYVRDALAALPPTGVTVTRGLQETLPAARAISALIRSAGVVYERLVSDTESVNIIDQYQLGDALKGLEPFLPIGDMASPTSFEWTDDMHKAFTEVQALKGKRFPFMDQLLFLWKALNEAARYE